MREGREMREEWKWAVVVRSERRTEERVRVVRSVVRTKRV